VILAVITVAAQIAYPLTPVGSALDGLTVATVIVFAAASVSHAVVCRGWGFAAVLVVVTAGGGLGVEALGVATGVPFGSYAYSDSLGWQLAGVPAVIPLAWTMMGYPALLVGRRIASGRWWGPAVAGWALASWDLFLDPQMVEAGHWVWLGQNEIALLGVPATNFVAWFAIATVMMTLLWRLGETAAQASADDRVPVGLYLWSYASSVMAHAVFLGLPLSALVGGVGMGAVVAALAWVSLRRRPPTGHRLTPA
jgi:putative membrane protein